MPQSKAQLNKRLLVGIVLDRSSSMESILAATISGTNEQFSALRDSDDAANTFVAFLTFNQKVTPVLKKDDGSMKLVPCADLVDITEGDYVPSGMTAMRDGVNNMVDFLAGEAKKIDDVLVVVISDGAENASSTLSSTLASKVKELQDAGWNFTYIGANQDLTQVSADLGIHTGNMLSFDANMAGASSMHSTVSGAVANYAATRSAGISAGSLGRTVTRSLYSDAQLRDQTLTGDDSADTVKDSQSGNPHPAAVKVTTTGDGTTV
jgi:hypothetical protein